MMGLIVLDLSRLLSRAARRVPTGIDRVEHAYAETLLSVARSRLRYAALHPLGRFTHLPTARARQFVERTGYLWQHAMPRSKVDPTFEPVADAQAPERSANGVQGLARRLYAGMMLPHASPRFLRDTNRARPTYLLVSHHHLHQPHAIETAKRRLGANFVCFIHDLIPIELPEYGRPLEAEKHRRRMETATRLADAIVVNSAATRDALMPFMRKAGRDVPLLVAPLGVDTRRMELSCTKATEPYFIYIGTIEPRKNHLLLFNIWRRLAETMGERTPKLLLVGQRGWENEMVLDVLERSESLRPHIREFNALPDIEVASLVRGARALLLPSFAEGYGLPIAEALSSGTPVLCSDLPALREVGGNAPEYLDPLDGLGWLAAVSDYTEPASVRRARQIERIAAWSPPDWKAHINAVMTLIGDLSTPGAAGLSEPLRLPAP